MELYVYLISFTSLAFGVCLQLHTLHAITVPQHSENGSGVGYAIATATRVMTGDVGEVISTAESSADTSVTNRWKGPNVTGNGNGEGISTGWVNSTDVVNPTKPSNSVATIDLTGNAGGSGTSIIIGNNSQQVFRKLISILPKHPSLHS